MKGNKGLHTVTFILLVIGGLNWGLMGLLGAGIGDWVGEGIAKIIYILVGLSALYELLIHKKDCRLCTPSSA